MKRSSRTRFRLIAMGAVVALLLLGAFTQSSIPGINLRNLLVNDQTPPVIDVWYGQHQVFGSPAVTQRWVNILGRVSDAESGVAGLTYSLNGGAPVALRLGPDDRRLSRAGDFNVELDMAGLKDGENTLVLDAKNEAGLDVSDTVTVEIHRDSLPLPYSIDWSTVKNISDAAQVLDGKWSWDASGIRTADVGYDRILSLGDQGWTDYEVTVPVTVYGIFPGAFDLKVSPGAGFGVLLRFLGYTDNPLKCDYPAQPHCGWNPVGASNWYSFKKTGVDELSIESEPPTGATKLTNFKIQPGDTVMFKQRVETTPAGNLYRFKVWKPAVESEPSGWTIERTAVPGDDVSGNLKHGSILLVAYNVDLKFGNVTVAPLSKAQTALPQIYLPLAVR